MLAQAATKAITQHRIFATEWPFSRKFWGINLLRTKLTSNEFMVKCFPCGDANWEFNYPEDDDLMCTPNMWDKDSELCLLVVKNGGTTNTTIGHANGIFSILLTGPNFTDEWTIMNYDSKSEVFSDDGDSGSVVADICGHIGGMITGGTRKTKSSNLSYATPFWWLLEHIKAKGFPNTHLGVYKEEPLTLVN
ncbi:hypothetical protein EDB89DRAFT_1911093 [Lactarius sanguifluus]|nr:hypothetical protein EDB89DRAFT_1911093 [Lactarius sanguifluus]